MNFYLEGEVGDRNIEGKNFDLHFRRAVQQYQKTAQILTNIFEKKPYAKIQNLSLNLKYLATKLTLFILNSFY